MLKSAVKLAGIIGFALLLSGCGDNKDETLKFATQYVMAISWQPAFCEGAERKRECRTQSRDRFDASHFSLHGLWPQPGNTAYCGVSDKEISLDKKGRWRELDTARIGNSIWAKLRRMMPGTQSALHKHEWIKHGTCTPADIDEYYARSIEILEEINGSSLQKLFSRNIANELTGAQIRNAFERSFGSGSGDRLRISCKRDQNSARQLIVELTFGLADPFQNKTDLAGLISAAPRTDPGCPSGIVDPVGFQ